MAVRKHYPDDASYSLALRIDRALGALSGALNNFTPKPRQTRIFKKKSARRGLTPPARTSVSTQPPRRVLDAMVDAFARIKTPDSLGEQTYYQIKSATGLNDDALGLALNSLIPRFLCTRDDGEERIYFLPRLKRRQLNMPRSKNVLRKVA